jgi:hypothetical protein
VNLTTYVQKTPRSKKLFNVGDWTRVQVSNRPPPEERTNSFLLSRHSKRINFAFLSKKNRKKTHKKKPLKKRKTQMPKPRTENPDNTAENPSTHSAKTQRKKNFPKKNLPQKKLKKDKQHSANHHQMAFHIGLSVRPRYLFLQSSSSLR